MRMQVREALEAVHQALVDGVRSDYERVYGRVSNGELLQLMLKDQVFAWLRPMSALMAEIDEGGVAEQDRARRLADLTGSEHYLLMMQREPSVAVAHGQLRAAIRAERLGASENSRPTLLH